MVFGTSSSPFLLNATIRHHLQLYRSSKPGLVETLTHSTYVDDTVTGPESEGEAYQLYIESKDVLSHVSFNLRKFLSYSPHLQQRIDGKEATLNSPPVLHPPPIVRAPDESFSEVTIPADPVSRPGEHMGLGVCWSIWEDQPIFNLTHLVEKAAKLQPTKRNVVSVIG